MRISVPMMVDDPLTQRKKNPAENVTLEEEFFLDGPVSRRVAIVDFEKDGSLTTGARFLRVVDGKYDGTYVIPRRDNVYSRAFIQVSVFATVLKTMALFEDEKEEAKGDEKGDEKGRKKGDVLGRKLTWGFNSPQLLVVPRAGEWENAFYDRDSRSLQFFYFRSRGGSRGQVYTALSRDIVAHETGHAILDGVAPDLYDAVTPQSLALHEAVADLTALLSAFASRTLRTQVLAETGGRIDQPSAFSAIASQFQAGRTGSDTQTIDFANHALRNLMNERTLDPDLIEPHALSEVLSGALYRLMLKIYDDVKGKKAAPEGDLAVATLRFRRIVFRGLDYLPPGEVSFADYARAILASDEASFPDGIRYRETIAREFVKRGIVAAESDLAVKTNFTDRALESIDLATLVQSDWAAYEFANRNRKLLKIPDDRPFRVRPRLDVTKTYIRGPRISEEVRECIFKVSWEMEERNRVKGMPAKRQVTVGTTMAIDWNTKTIRALLTSEHLPQRDARDAMLKALDAKGMLLPMTELLGPGGRPLRHAIGFETADGVMRVRGVGNLLHITGAAV